MDDQKIKVRTAKTRKREPTKSAFGLLFPAASILMGSVAGVCIAAVLLWTAWGKDPLRLFTQEPAPTPELASASPIKVQTPSERQATKPDQPRQDKLQKHEPSSTADVLAQVDGSTATELDAETLVVPDENSDVSHAGPDKSNNGESPKTDLESEPVTDGRLAVPSQADQEQALATIKSLFEEQYRVAKTKEQKLNLASEMIKVSEDTREDVAGKYVLLRVARDIATAQSEIDTTESSIATMESSFAVDGTELRIEAWQELLSNTAASDATQKALSKKLVGRVLRHAEQRFNDTDDVAVLKTIEFADAQLNAFIDDKQQQNLGDLTRAAKTRQELLESKNAAEMVLETHPLDPDANEKLGRYYCFYLGQWERGLRYLSRSGNRILADLATSDLNANEAGNYDTSAAAIADGWWEYAQGALLPPSSSYEADSSAIVKEHAAVWYKRSLGTSTGLTRKVAETRIAEVDSIIGMETDAAHAVKKNETAKNKLAAQKKHEKRQDKEAKASTSPRKNASLVSLLNNYVDSILEERPIEAEVAETIGKLGYPEAFRIVGVPQTNGTRHYLRAVNKLGEGHCSNSVPIDRLNANEIQKRFAIAKPLQIYTAKRAAPLTEWLPEPTLYTFPYRGNHQNLYKLTKWVLSQRQGTFRVFASHKYGATKGYPALTFFGFGANPKLWLVAFNDHVCLGKTKSLEKGVDCIELFDSGNSSSSMFVRSGVYARWGEGVRYTLKANGDIAIHSGNRNQPLDFVSVWPGSWIR